MLLGGASVEYFSCFLSSCQLGLTLNYCKIASSNTFRLEAHIGFFRLVMKGILRPYDLMSLCCDLLTKSYLLITRIRTCNCTVVKTKIVCKICHWTLIWWNIFNAKCFDFWTVWSFKLWWTQKLHCFQKSRHPLFMP